jgi:hypothetical protein
MDRITRQATYKAERRLSAGYQELLKGFAYLN